MRKILGLAWICSLLAILLAGCGVEGMQTGKDGEMDAPYFEGMIYSISENKSSILVIEGIEHADIPQSEWQGKEAISFSIGEDVKIFDKVRNEISREELIKGQKVRVYHTGQLAESYPMQGKALLITVITDDSDSNAGDTADQVIAEVQEGDFILQLVADKSDYQSNERVNMRAQLKYAGEEGEVTIGHAASPFWFEVTETNKNITIPYPMQEPLIMTELVQGEWYSEQYLKSGGYSENDPEADFVKEFLKGDFFPHGEYTVVLRAQFFVELDGQKHNYNFSTPSITFKVR